MLELKWILRVLLRQWVTTLGVVVTLALGIAGVATVFGVAYGAISKSFAALDQPERVVWLFETKAGKLDLVEEGLRPANYFDWKARAQSLEATTSIGGNRAILEYQGRVFRLSSFAVGADFFKVLGVRTALGRSFTPEDEKPGAWPTVVLSHPVFQNRFGGDAAIVGKSIVLNGVSTTVIGVLPSQMLTTLLTDAYVPMRLSPEEKALRSEPRFAGLARLAPGFTLERANQELGEIGRALEHAYPQENKSLGVQAVALPDVFMAQRSWILLMLGFAGASVLLVACFNVACLGLARFAEQRREAALKAALGAGTPRLLKERLLESGILCGLAALLGLALTRGALAIVVASVPAALLRRSPGLAQLEVDGPLVLFVGLVALCLVIGIGALPVFLGVRPQLYELLNGGNLVATEGKNLRRLRKLAVSVQVFAVTALCLAATVAYCAVRAQARIPLGFNPEGVSLASLSLPRKEELRERFLSELAGRVRAQPGIAAAGFTTHPPLERGYRQQRFSIGQQALADRNDLPWALGGWVGAEYFETVRTPMLEGRSFTERDNRSAPRVAILSENAAKRLFPGASPLGKTLYLEGKDPCAVVGVVAEAQTEHKGEQGFIYSPLVQQTPENELYLAVRSTLGPAELESAVVRAVQGLDPEQVPNSIEPLNRRLEGWLWLRRFLWGLLGALTVMALVLAVTGIYGTTRYSVACRGAELAIRLTLGESPRGLVRQVLGEALGLAAVGVGVALALTLTVVIQGPLSQAQPLSAADFSLAVAVLLTVLMMVCLAAYAPIRKVVQNQPLRTLRRA